MTFSASAVKRNFDSELHQPLKKAKTNHNSQAVVVKSANKVDRTQCRGCGRYHTGDCIYKTHPLFNKTNRAWAESDPGMKLARFNINQLPPNKNLVGDNLVDISWQVQNQAQIISDDSETNVISTIRGRSLLVGTVLGPRRPGNDATADCTTMLDTGAMQANYISESCMLKLYNNFSSIKIKILKHKKLQLLLAI